MNPREQRAHRTVTGALSNDLAHLVELTTGSFTDHATALNNHATLIQTLVHVSDPLRRSFWGRLTWLVLGR